MKQHEIIKAHRNSNTNMQNKNHKFQHLNFDTIDIAVTTVDEGEIDALGVTKDGRFMIVGITIKGVEDAAKINIYGVEHGHKLEQPIGMEWIYGHHHSNTHRQHGKYFPHQKEITGIVARRPHQEQCIFYTASKDFYVKEWRFHYQSQKVHLERTWKNLDLEKGYENENWKIMLTKDEYWLLVADEWNNIYQLPTDTSISWEGRSVKKYSNLGLSKLSSWDVDAYSQIMYVGDDDGNVLEVQMDETKAISATMSHKRKVGDKKITSIYMSPDDMSLLCGDQAGDVKRVQVTDRNQTGKEFLGKIHKYEINHLSTFNDSEKQKWMITGCINKLVTKQNAPTEDVVILSLWTGYEFLPKYDLTKELRGVRCMSIP